MRNNSPTTSNWTWPTTLWIVTLGLLTGAAPTAWAEESAPAAQNSIAIVAPSSANDEQDWIELPSIAERSLVQIWFAGPRRNVGGPCFVITHGMGGTLAGDHFHRLAAAIRKSFPRAGVVRLDWSEKASAKFGGFPNPWKVAESIDKVGDQAALVLKKEGFNPANTTFIGESFGNWVNARIANQLGGVEGILALNPAHEGGGYAPPNLCKHAKRSWSFHTYSIFDTTLEIADGDFWLETRPGASQVNQHVAGIDWLAARIEAGDHSWLSMDKTLPERQAGHFRASAMMDGQLSEQQLPRERPVTVGPSDVAAVAQ